MLNRVRKDYARVWERVCVDWLGWPKGRFQRFLRAYNAKLQANGDTWFYHEPALYHVVPLLVTDEFSERLHEEVRKHRYGTPEWVYFRSELLMAIEGVPKRQGRFNWAEAKARAEEHLAIYRQKFPSKKTATDYERWILGFYNPKLTRLLQATFQ